MTNNTISVKNLSKGVVSEIDIMRIEPDKTLVIRTVSGELFNLHVDKIAHLTTAGCVAVVGADEGAFTLIFEDASEYSTWMLGLKHYYKMETLSYKITPDKSVMVELPGREYVAEVAAMNIADENKLHITLRNGELSILDVSKAVHLTTPGNVTVLGTSAGAISLQFSDAEDYSLWELGFAHYYGLERLFYTRK